METAQLSFEQILNATVRMMRTTWKTKLCLFLQMDDHGNLRIRAADGFPQKNTPTLAVNPTVGAFKTCISKNQIVEVNEAANLDALGKFIKSQLKKGEKFVLTPVSGETRVLGVLFMGPFAKKEKVMPREAEFRSAGALCAVLSAHWRLYEGMSNFLPPLHHHPRH